MFTRFSSSTTGTPGASPFGAQNAGSFGTQNAGSFGGSTNTAPSGSNLSSALTFGGSSGSFGSTAGAMTVGGPAPPYTTTTETENGFSIKLLSITAMPAHRARSQEELRVEDYARGRKGPASFPGSAPGAFSQPFSSTSASTGTAGVNPFGSSGLSSAPAPAPFSAPSGSLFGAAPSNTSGGLFGQPQHQPQPSAFSAGSSAFGQPQMQQQPPAQPPSSFGGFGFGASTGSAMSASSAAGFGKPASSLFGPSAPAAPMSGLFGQPAAPASTAPFGSFGSGGAPSTPASQPSGGFSFGGSATGGNTGLFSQPTPAPAPAPQSFFQQPQPAASGSLFGSTANPQATSTPLSFGQPTAPLFSGQPAAPAGSMFGGSSGGLFSQPRPSPMTVGTASGFGLPSATSTLAPSTQGGLFGSAPAAGLVSNAPAAAPISSFFGTRPASAATSFGASAAPSTATSFAPSTFATGGSLFGSAPSSNAAPSTALPLMAPSTLPASLTLNPPLPALYAPSAVPVSAPAVPTPRSPVKFTPRTSFRIKPRDTAMLPIPLNLTAAPGSSLNAAYPAYSAHPSGALVPRRTPDAPSLKKLVLTRPEDYSSASVVPPVAVSRGRPSAPDLSVPVSTLLTSSMSFGQLYMFPAEETLHAMAPADRRAVRNFIIGQKGVAQIRFLEPVNLADIDIDRIFGHLVQFSDGEAALYPDPTIPKPPPGHGLNVSAEVRIERVWTLSRGSREPILDPASEKVLLFTEKLRATAGTQFVSYDPGSGTWVFTVAHF